jgi:hypothetical protein
MWSSFRLRPPRECSRCYLGRADGMRHRPDEGALLGPGRLDWPLVVGWTGGGLCSETCMCHMRKAGGAAESCRTSHYAAAPTGRPLSSTSTRQAAPTETCKILTIRRNEEAREMRSLRLCTYHVPQEKVRQGCAQAGTSLRIATSPQKRLNPHSARSRVARHQTSNFVS